MDHIKVDDVWLLPALEWINFVLKIRLEELAPLQQGCMFCDLFVRFHPGVIRKQDVLYNPNSMMEFLHNFGVLQEAMKDKVSQLKIDLPIEKLAEGDEKSLEDLVMSFQKYFIYLQEEEPQKSFKRLKKEDVFHDILEIACDLKEEDIEKCIRNVGIMQKSLATHVQMHAEISELCKDELILNPQNDLATQIMENIEVVARNVKHFI